ncbi:hypothetical protein ABW19_dt0204668 [Dactylella cylindrospora]|nr:hypothetical protein ABW19_dt0204668 [Dactylella cylindrospora]
MDELLDYQELRKNHPGWCTIESEPAIFSQLLHDAGVPNVVVKELYSLDQEVVDNLGPTCGLIFLSRWKEEKDDTEEMEINCPDGVWFANQILDNSCASLAMLNILFNSESVILGEELTQFRSFTSPLTPPLRGLCLQNFEFLRRVHNSFARYSPARSGVNLRLLTAAGLCRRSEILQNNLDALSSCRKTAAPVIESSSSSEAAYHFIAYVPSDGKVWELDGLRRQPINIGEFGESGHWLLAATPRIQHRISRFSENELMFTLLAFTHERGQPEIGRGLANSSIVRVEFEETEFPYALRVKHSYAAFMRRYIQLLANKGIRLGG